jgi:glycosyltransferase involved in cell wall biosynthesis
VHIGLSDSRLHLLSSWTQSLSHENSPVVIQEAFAAGVPVIASDVGALPEKVRPDVDGLLCAPGEVKAWRDRLVWVVERKEAVEAFQDNLPEPMTIQRQTISLEEVCRSMWR